LINRARAAAFGLTPMVVTFVLSAFFLPKFLLDLIGNDQLWEGDLPVAGRIWVFSLLAIVMELADLRKRSGRALAELHLRLMPLPSKLAYVACNAVSAALFMAWMAH
jgi:hypothetical protein